MLKFSPANAKTRRLTTIPQLAKYLKGRKVYSLDLLSGWSCPGAKDCLSKVIIDNGKRKIKDGPHTQFRCFSASQEVLYPAVYNARKANFEAIKGKRAAAIRDMILRDLPRNCGILRYHVGGDFFSRYYLQAAYAVALARPDVLFYGYTKALNYLEYLNCDNLKVGQILPNFLITASRGGRYDRLIPLLGIRTATVVYNENTRLPIDHTDSHAATKGGNFALLIHGTQPANTPAAAAWQKIKTTVGGYSK